MSKKTSKKNKLKIGLNDSGRLDQFLAKSFPDYSRTFFKRLIDARDIVVDGHPVSAHHKCRPGQTVEIKWKTDQTAPVLQGAAEWPFKILHEEEEFLVLDKPPHLLVHPTGTGRNGDTLVEMLSEKVAKKNWPDSIRPGLIHRLDRDTSGILVFAKTPEAHHFISKQFSNRTVKKTYEALVHGVIKEKSGKIVGSIGRNPRKRKQFMVTSDGRQATTEFLVKETFDHASWVELHPLTGRTHQIRIHLANYGYPILGDVIYGKKDRTSVIKRQMLHAREISILHPGHKKENVL